jgi:MYXO-CTERM domain-containing protein
VSSHTNLQERLDRYGITARGQIGRGPTAGEIAGYAAAAGVGLVLAGGADAQVIYSGIQNLSLEITPGATAGGDNFASAPSNVPIDIDGNGVDDVFLRLSFNAEKRQGTQGLSVTYYGIGANLVADTAAGAKFVGSSVRTSQQPGSLAASNLTRGQQIGGSRVFNANSAGISHKQARPNGAATVSSATVGTHFNLSAVGIVGVRLASGNFGWIRLHIEDLGTNQPFRNQTGDPWLPGTGFPDKITVVDWAYDNEGGAIEAPVSSPLALLAAGAVGLAAFRRRRQERQPG